jgi:hypothetical protein
VSHFSNSLMLTREFTYLKYALMCFCLSFPKPDHVL